MARPDDPTSARVTTAAGAPPGAGQGPRRSSFVTDLTTVLRSRGFRQLFGTRLISQAGDGLFTSGLGAYVFFNAQSFPDPAAAAAAFAVLYLPYSLVGPFAGVFIDRWSRRQILVVAAQVRAVFVCLTALFIATGTLGFPVYAGALVVIGVNRFFLAALSAALPHVVPADELVMANSVGPTSGTIMTFIGGITGIGLHLLTRGGQVGSAVTLVVSGCCFALAGLVPLRIARPALGPDGAEQARAPASVTAGLAAVAGGLAAGARHAWARRPVRAALAAVGGHRLLYAVLLLMSVLLYRNYFYPHNSNSALRHYLAVVVSSGAGYGVAALLTPVATRRLSAPAWITVLLASAGVLTAAFGLAFSQVGFVVVGFELGVGAQGLSICATTIVQLAVEDGYRGRIFSIYDMVFNVTFVLGAAASAGFMPPTGRSAPLLAAVCACYIAVAAGYWALARQSPGPPSALPPPSPASAAQRDSS